MYIWKPAPRHAQTTIPCRECEAPLTARRTCHHAYIKCDSCGKEYEIQDVLSDMDAALEQFLEAVNCDRV